MSRADEEAAAVVTLCSICGKPLSSRDIGCPSCGSVDQPSPGPDVDARVSVVPAAKAIPGRILVGTVISIGRPRQEPVVHQAVPVVCRVSAAAALLAVVGATQPGGPSFSPVTTTFAVSCLALLTVLGFLLRGAVAKAVATPRSARNPLLTTVHVTPDERSGVRKVFHAIARALALPLRAASSGPTVDVVPLSVKEVSGASTRCDVRGSARGGTPVRGDVVEVYGKRSRRGTVVVRQFVATSDGGTRPVRMPPACAVVRSTSAVIACAWTLAALGLVVLLVVGR
jgi:hypothetical protein